MSGTLMAHKDTTVVTEAVVRKEPAPPFTSTWHPLPHADVIDAVAGACAKQGWEVERKTYSLKPNERMFAVWDLKSMNNKVVKTGDNTLSIGIRNSINKELSVGLCAGERVFVCDNLVFAGDFVLFRKHTGLLTREELVIMADEALVSLSVKYDALLTWHESLKDFKLSDANAAMLAVAAMHRPYPLISPSQFDDFFKLYFEDRPRYSPTLHGFHGAVTEMFQKHPAFYMLARSERLVNFLNFEAKELCSKVTHHTFDFKKIREQAEERRKDARMDEIARNREAQATVKGRVRERLKADKQRNGVAAEPPAKKKSEKKADKNLGKVLTKALAKTIKKVEKDAAALPAEKKQRRTTRVKVREQVAAEAPVVKTKTQRAPKGEKVTSAKRAKKAFVDDDDTLFCDKCSGEFKPSELDENRLCAKCRAKK